MRGDANRKSPLDAAESKTLRMRGNSLHGNRETLETPSLQPSGGRSEKRKIVVRLSILTLSGDPSGRSWSDFQF